MRHLIVPLVLMGALGCGGAALASDIALHKHTPEDVKAVCAKAGGSFSESAGSYGCGTDCKGGKGTDCLVTCAPDKPCTAQVIGAKRPRTIEQALAPGKKKR